MSDDECGHQRMVAHCWGCYQKELATLLARAQTAETELARKEEALGVIARLGGTGSGIARRALEQATSPSTKERG